MNSMQLQPANLRRWCRTCGLPSPMGQPCGHCGGALVAPQRARALSAVLNDSCGMVQNNVVSVENLYDSPPDNGPPPPAKPSVFHRMFMTTCMIAMWIGILSIGSVLAILFLCVYRALSL
jgi:hypothetical protein